MCCYVLLCVSIWALFLELEVASRDCFSVGYHCTYGHRWSRDGTYNSRGTPPPPYTPSKKLIGFARFTQVVLILAGGPDPWTPRSATPLVETVQRHNQGLVY